ncbi:MAG: hypothetical protein HY929_01210 [Euryarchaeota archaeon]|nr:hypothetical protein [Euryarchaeota archaeon]
MGRLSIRVNLAFVKQFDVELLKKVPDYDGLLRLVCDISFKTTKGWTEAEDAIIDTGAHTSLLPLSLWQELDVKIISDHYVRGLVPKPECKIDVKVGWVTGKIIDEHENSTPEIKFRAFLALVDNIPLIMGFKDLLERYHIDIDAMVSKASIETQ